MPHPLHDYLKSMKDDVERARFAVECGTTLGSLRNAIYGKHLRPTVCVLVEQRSGKRVMRWHLRDDWHQIWPELVGTTGAPHVARPARMRTTMKEK